MYRFLFTLALLIPISIQAQTLSTATFAMGCFWCGEEALEKVPGVVSVVSG